MQLRPVRTVNPMSTAPASLILTAFCLLPLSARGQEAEEEQRDDLVHEVDQIVVTGSRTEQRVADTVVATEVISRKQIERTGSDTLLDILQSQPGIQLNYGFQTGASVRLQGLGSKYVLILIDGERTLGRVDGELDLSRFNAEDIERVEIIRGASSALYGSDALGGVINVITRRCRGGGPRGELRAEYGSMNAMNATGNAGYCTKTYNLNLTGGWHHRDSYDLEPNDAYTNGSEYDEYNVEGKLEYHPSEFFKLTGKSGYTFRDLSGVQSGRYSSLAVFDRKNRTETADFSLVPEFHFDPLSKLKVSAHYSYYKDQYLNDQRGGRDLDSYQLTTEQLGELNLQYDQLIFAQHLFTIGMDSLVEGLKTPRLNRTSASRARFAPFIQDEWTVIDQLTLQPGARLDVDSHFGTHVTPKIALRADPTEELILRASYAWGYRAPDFKEMYILFENPSVGYRVIGNPDLTPETSQSVNIGGEYRPVQQLWISINAFRNDIKDMIAYATVDTTTDPTSQINTTYQNVNISKAMTQGIESMVKVEILRGLVFELGYTYLDTEDKEDGLELSGRAHHNIKGMISYTNKKLGLDISLRGFYLSKQPAYYVDANNNLVTVYYPAYTKLDARVAQDVFKHYLTVYAGVDNILDAGDNSSEPLVPRAYYIGAIARY